MSVSVDDKVAEDVAGAAEEEDDDAMDKETELESEETCGVENGGVEVKFSDRTGEDMAMDDITKEVDGGEDAEVTTVELDFERPELVDDVSVAELVVDEELTEDEVLLVTPSAKGAHCPLRSFVSLYRSPTWAVPAPVDTPKTVFAVCVLLIA